MNGMKRRYKFANHFATPRDIPNFMPGFGIAAMNGICGNFARFKKTKKRDVCGVGRARPRKKTVAAAILKKPVSKTMTCLPTKAPVTALSSVRGVKNAHVD